MSLHDDDAEILAAAREGFLAEAREQLQAFESALLVMETDPGDSENLNAAFRAAHTIKGTAGLFGCDAVAAFTHEVETLMEALRSGQREVDGDIAAALLESLDQIGVLLDEINLPAGAPEVAARSVELGARLRRLCAGGSAAPAAGAAASSASAASGATAAAGSTATASAAATGTGTAASSPWHLSLRFGTDALRNGLDPLAFIRYLGSLGTVRSIRTLVDQVPALEALDAESCHLGFELAFDTSAHPATDRAAIEQVFEFALDDAEITLLEPHADAAAFEALLAQRSGGDAARRAALQALWLDMGVAPAAAPAAADAFQATTSVARNADPAAAEHAAEAAPEADAAPPAAEAPAAERRGETQDRRSGGGRRQGDDARYVRVRADKLDRLIDIIGELVIAGSGVQTAALAEAAALSQEAAQRVCDLVEEARDGALALRMVPVGETFSRFHRVVRDVSKQLGKEVELVVSGGDTELDKSMVDVIADPLTHLVRNSLDHGIERPEDRVAAGKPAKGKLALHAYHEAGAIVIEVSDDGRGLVRERILAKAIERGLVAADAQLSDAEVWQLIFAPGFSTAEQVTNVSGRGVGMDVVKRNIESLRGQISIASQPGLGTTMQLRLPLTLAIIDGFLTQVGKVHYVIPLAVVAECIDLPVACRGTDCAAPMAGTFDLRGAVLPWLDLARWYGHLEPGAALPARRSLVVVNSGGQRVGLVVDRLLGEHQTVIKPLAGIFGPLKALAGSTILGSGEVALVLDMPGLMAAVIEHTRQARASPAAAPPRAAAPSH
jgi:two-component system chemotaxis sensor kinase CheA